jgi:hypothetical protein
MSLLPDQLGWAAATGKSGGGSIVVLLAAALHVLGDAGVQRAIGTASESILQAALAFVPECRAPRPLVWQSISASSPSAPASCANRFAGMARLARRLLLDTATKPMTRNSGQSLWLAGGFPRPPAATTRATTQLFSLSPSRLDLHQRPPKRHLLPPAGGSFLFPLTLDGFRFTGLTRSVSGTAQGRATMLPVGTMRAISGKFIGSIHTERCPYAVQ